MGWALRMLLTISAVLLPLYFYVGFRTAASIALLKPAWKPGARRIVLVVIGWMYLLPVIFLLLYLFGARGIPFLQTPSVGLLDYLFHYPVWIGMIVIAELLLPFILFDLIAATARFFPSKREKVRKILAIFRCGLLALAVCYVPIRATVDTTHVRDSLHTVTIGELPAELRGLRITLVGDVQVDRYTGQGKVGQVHEIVRKQAPDLLFSGGDVVTSGKDFLAPALRAMCGMRGSIASVAVMGDHDQWSAPEEIRAAQIECGWIFLDNQHKILTVRGRSVLVSGLTHVYSDRMDDGELEAFFEGAPKADLRILLSHQPAQRMVERAARHGYDLILAGHTHGGQIVLHPLGIPLTPSMRETSFYTGLFTEGRSTVVVTNGVGLSLAPLRYHAPAEVTTLVLE